MQCCLQCAFGVWGSGGLRRGSGTLRSWWSCACLSMHASSWFYASSAARDRRHFASSAVCELAFRSKMLEDRNLLKLRRDHFPLPIAFPFPRTGLFSHETKSLRICFFVAWGKCLNSFLSNSSFHGKRKQHLIQIQCLSSVCNPQPGFRSSKLIFFLGVKFTKLA